MGTGFTEVFEFEVCLKSIRPRIWRRLEVPDGYSFWALHVAIQDAMGWKDYHLHAFTVGGSWGREAVVIGIPDPDGMDVTPVLPGWDVPIARIFGRPGDAVRYEYDFGDSWEHEIKLVSMGPRVEGIRYPRCVAGARACPPEDCGGVPGYQRLLKVIRNPRHKEHEETLDWVGDQFDPERFEPTRVRFSDPARRWRKAFASNHPI